MSNTKVIRWNYIQNIRVLGDLILNTHSSNIDIHAIWNNFVAPLKTVIKLKQLH